MRLFKFLMFVFFLLSLSSNSYGQIKKYKSENVSKSAEKLERGIQSNDDRISAEAYVEIGLEFENKGQMQKALDNYKNGEKLFRKLKDNGALTDVLRKIGKLEETLLGKEQASKSYSEAQKAAPSEKSYQNEINDLDNRRTRVGTSPETDEELINEKIGILNSSPIDTSKKGGLYSSKDDRSNELYDSYVQLANNQIQQKKYDAAITNLKNAKIEVHDEPDKIVSLNSEISDLYLKTNKPELALQTQINSLDIPEIKSDPTQKVKVIGKIADIYLLESKEDKALNYLKDSYNVAVESGQTLVARDILLKLEKLFVSTDNTKETTKLHHDFLMNLDKILLKDSSIVDEVKLKAAELKIENLEKEKVLKDDLISKQNLINYLLISGIILLIIFLYFIFKAFQKAERSNKIIELQSLRKEMNPHFIFNSLNSINHFISNKSEIEANNYLTRFSMLMRSVLDKSNKNFILLKEEIELIKNYLELEHQRFNKHFEYEIEVDEHIDTNKIYIPNMIIQPYIENAIWHGLRYKKEKGLVKLTINKHTDYFIIIIEDNGIGIEESQKIKTEHQKNKSSVSTNNISKRIELLNKLYNFLIQAKSEYLYQKTGTKITISVPFFDSKYHKTEWKKELEQF